jgi:hypothetical protein
VSSRPGHVRYAAESGSKFRASSAPLRGRLNLQGCSRPLQGRKEAQLSKDRPVQGSRGTNKAASALRQKSNFTRQINADSTVHSRTQKYLLCPSGKSSLKARPSRASLRGALRGRHDLPARDAMDAIVPPDERHGGGRRSRVVLMPRRWHQRGDDCFGNRTGDGGKKARSPGRARSSR